MGRIASFPIDNRGAALVGDTLDSRLHGELRTVQLAGRLAELVAYALEAMLHQPEARTAAMPRRRDLDLARAAPALAPLHLTVPKRHRRISYAVLGLKKKNIQ